MFDQLAVRRGDVFGGLTAGIVALPLCLAFGVASGLGAAAGLYGAMTLGILAALFGGTPVQISGPTAPMTLVSAGVVAANMLPSGEINLPVVFGTFVLAGALQALCGIMRLGQYIRFLPYPVISGLMTGVGIIILVQQIFPLAGLSAPASDPLTILRSLPQLVGHVQWGAVLLAAATIALLYGLPRFVKVLPPSLFALVGLTLAAVLFGINAPTIGKIAGGLPGLIVPSFDLAHLRHVIVPAVQLAILGSIDSLTTSLVADNLTKTHHNSDRELIGQGIGNMGAALLGGLPGAGAFVRTAVNIKAGGRNRSSGVIHGLFLIAVLLGLSNFVQYIPHAVLAGILVGAGLGIIDYRSLSHLSTTPRSDVIMMLIVLFLTVFSDLITAVGVGMIFAAFVFMAKMSEITEKGTRLSLISDEPWADELTIPAESRDELLIKHVDGPLFFGFVHAFRAAASRTLQGKLLVLRMDRVSYVDQSGLYALQDVLVDLKNAGVRVVLVGFAQDVRERLEAQMVIPDLVPSKDVFDSFASFRAALPAILGEFSEAPHLVPA
jgi:SulP family sulfate permease